MSNLSDLLPAGGKQVDFVASGTLSSGQTVALRSDGKVEAVTSINSADFIGITAEAISNAASGSVTIKGGISTNVIGLTPNRIYYVQDDGSLSTIVSDVVAGKAISSTSINLDYTT